MSAQPMVRFFDVILYPLEALLSLLAFVFWMICWAIWQIVRGAGYLATVVRGWLS
jgi:hypothetical protein